MTFPASLFLALTAAAVSAPAPATGEPEPQAWLVEREETRHPIAAGLPVAIRNAWGNVIVRVGEEGELMVLSLAQRHRDDPRVAGVGVSESAGASVVEVVYPAPAMPEPVAGWKKRRVDLTVLAPPGAAVSVVTIDGDVEARGLRESLRVETSRGAVRARTGGSVKATSEHGEIAVHFLSTRWTETSRLATTTGPITAALPAGGDASVQFRTAGMVTTDYSVEIERDATSSRKTGAATIGEGGPLLEIESDRGPITLMASLVPDVMSHETGSAEVPR